MVAGTGVRRLIGDRIAKDEPAVELTKMEVCHTRLFLAVRRLNDKERAATGIVIEGLGQLSGRIELHVASFRQLMGDIVPHSDLGVNWL
jgi:hypothetical protein